MAKQLMDFVVQKCTGVFISASCQAMIIKDGYTVINDFSHENPLNLT